MFWSRMLTDGALLSVLGGLLIVGSLRANPRIWLNDFPPDIRAAVPPKTPAEKRQSLVWGVPFLLLLVGVPTLSSYLLKRQQPEAGFATLFANAYGVGLIFNAVDLLLIDWMRGRSSRALAINHRSVFISKLAETHRRPP